VAIELHVVQFWSEIILVISKRTRATRSFNFEITRMISDQIALHSVQLPLFNTLMGHPVKIFLIIIIIIIIIMIIIIIIIIITIVVVIIYVLLGTQMRHQIARDTYNVMFVTYFELFQRNHFQHQLADCWIARHL